MLIVEGPDLVGKTTLAKQLVQALNKRAHAPYMYAWFGKLPRPWDYYWNYLPHARRYIVQDRFHMSEIVYRRAQRTEQNISPDQYRLMDGMLRGLGAFTVIIHADSAFLRRMHEANADRELFDVATVLRANEAFRDVIQNNSPFGVEYECADWDMQFDIGTRGCFPGEDPQFIDDVLKRYAHRQAIVNGIWRRRDVTQGSVYRKT